MAYKFEQRCCKKRAFIGMDANDEPPWMVSRRAYFYSTSAQASHIL
ncbi:MAG: hypothetical protein ACI9DO_001245, partial [Reinekea sp.]